VLVTWGLAWTGGPGPGETQWLMRWAGLGWLGGGEQGRGVRNYGRFYCAALLLAKFILVLLFCNRAEGLRRQLTLYLADEILCSASNRSYYGPWQP
jgi:hypothetical protein